MPDDNQPPNPPPPPANPERKTLDDRAKLTELERIRHSCAHVLATAILRLWPDAQFAYGPPVENGFYYNVDLPHRISQEDFEKIEAEMKKEIKAHKRFPEGSRVAFAGYLAGRLGPRPKAERVSVLQNPTITAGANTRRMTRATPAAA